MGTEDTDHTRTTNSDDSPHRSGERLAHSSRHVEHLSAMDLSVSSIEGSSVTHFALLSAYEHTLGLPSE